MGLFGHKKRVYVFWCRFDDAQDIEGGNRVVQQLGTKEMAISIEKFTGKSFKPKNMRLLTDLMGKNYSKPLTQDYVHRISSEAWSILTKKYGHELFDKSKDVPVSGGACDFTIVPELAKYGLFIVFMEA